MALKDVKESGSINPKLQVQRGSLVALKKTVSDASEFVVVISNNIQNQSSEYLSVVPLQRRVSRLKAPFAVDLGREVGLRDLHVARCDWVMRVQQSDIKQILRAEMPDKIMQALSEALRVSLDL